MEQTQAKNTPSSGNEENAWFFEVIIAFLRSPRWRAPVMSFLDEHCIIFDNEEENKLEFTTVHKEFKDMVEKLLGELMEELGVTEEQFFAACESAKDNPQHKKIVAQITAVDSFLAFKKLMVKRNQDLNAQVLKMMTNPEEAAKEQAAQDEESKLADDEMIKKALEASKLQEEEKTKQQQEEEEMMKRAMELSLKESQITQPRNSEEEAMKQKLEELKRREEAIAQKERETAALEAELEKKKRLEEAMENARLQAAKEAEEDRLAFEARKQAQMAEKQKEEEEQQRKLEQEQEKERLAKMKEEDEKIKQKLAQQKAEKEKLKQQQQEEAKKLADQIKEQSVKAQSSLPPMNQGGSNALPSIGGRKGNFELDKDYLKKVQWELDGIADFGAKPKVQASKGEGKSMAELAKERREQTEKALAAQQANVPKQESVEERAARLKAQRDLLRKQKEAKRQEELEVFKEKTSNTQDLFSELKKIDNQIKNKAETQQKNQLSAEEMEKRRAVMKKARADLAKDEAAAKQQQTQSKPASDDPFGDIKSFSVK